MKTQYTSGPWQLDGFLVLSNDHNPRTIATVAYDQQGLRRGHETNEANAKLIAAAPELLSACQKGLKVAIAHALDCNPHIDLKPGESMEFDAAVAMVDLFRAAISKAVSGT